MNQGSAFCSTGRKDKFLKGIIISTTSASPLRIGDRQSVLKNGKGQNKMKLMKAVLFISFVLFTFILHPETADLNLLLNDPELGEID